MIIYKITNILNGKVYVGQTIRTMEERWKDHQSSFSRCLAIKSAIDKYGVENFKIDQIDSATDIGELNKKEGDWIVTLNSMSPGGYNLKSGGDQPRLCQESIDKIAVANTGKKAWNEGLTKDDLRVQSYIRYGANTHAYGKIGYRKGKKASEETRKKISEVRLGKKVSEETKKKMSDSHVKHQIKCTNNNEIYNSLMEAARALNLNPGNIQQVLKGKVKKTKGFCFEYLEDVNV